MKQLIVITILSLSACCPAPFDQIISDRIEGAWMAVTPPHSVYLFSDGILTQRLVVAGKEVYCNEYSYMLEGDIIRLVDILDGSKETWKIEFLNDSTVVIEPENWPLRIQIERIQ